MAGPFIWNGTNSKALTATASAANFVYGFNTTATSAGTLTLTGISAGIQQLTGTSTHDVVLPATNLVALGFQFQIINRSTQTVTVKGSTGSIVQSMATQTVLTVTASVSGAPGTWDVNYNDTAFAIPLAVAKGGTGTTTGSITGTGALTFAAGGTNQNVTLTPSGTGYTLLNGNVGVGTTAPNDQFHLHRTAAVDTPAAGLILTRYYAASNDMRGAGIFTYFDSTAGREVLAFGLSQSTTPNAIANAKMVIRHDGNVGIGTNAPGSTSHVAGSFQVKLSALSANTTLDGTYHAMTVDASGAARTITLPAASATIIGRVYRIKKIDSSANAVTIARTGADTIDGAPNYLLTTQYQSVDVICSSATTWSIF